MAYRRSRYGRRASYSRSRSRPARAYGGGSRGRSSGRSRGQPVVKLVIEHTAPTAVQRPDLAGVMVEKPTKRAKL